jgi:hypothetical protein
MWKGQCVKYLLASLAVAAVLGWGLLLRGDAAQADESSLADFGIPVFDESNLVRGGSGSAGAILAGPGIVRTTGADRATPWELIVPAARIRADVVRTTILPGAQVGAPDNPEVIGWWDDGPAPGQAGNVILDGHRDFTDINGNVGTGVCWQLNESEPGDLIVIRDTVTSDAWIYRITDSLSVVWDDPSGVSWLYGTLDSVLTLITCEGSFDRSTHNYSNRLIVRAELESVTPGAAISIRRTVTLQPGWNMLGWTMPGSTNLMGSPLAALLPNIFGWDATVQRFESFAASAPTIVNTLNSVQYGDGLWVRLGHRSAQDLRVAYGDAPRSVSLSAPEPGRPSFNLVTWTGPDRVSVQSATASLGDTLIAVYQWDARSQRFLTYFPGQAPFLSNLSTLRHGDALWVRVGQPITWQQSGR